MQKKDPMTDGTTENTAKIPAEWMDRILGAVRVTVNAAIMDYRNIRVSRLQEHIASLQQALENFYDRPALSFQLVRRSED
jgi:hypothetical protein